MSKFVRLCSKIIDKFCRAFTKLYGPEFVIYNVHCLIHLPDDVRPFGALDGISAFPFENYLRSVKKLIRKLSLPLEQVIRRVSEKSLSLFPIRIEKKEHPFCKYEHNSGPLIWPELFNAIQYKSVELKSFIFSLTENNNCVLLNNSKVGILQNILKRDLDIFTVVKLFQNANSFYEYPLDSKKLNAFKVSQIEDKLSNI